MGRLNEIERRYETIERAMEKDHKKNKGEFHSLALEDLRSGDVDEELWAACLAHCEFKKKKAAALYVRKAATLYETQQLEDELEELREQQEREERRELEEERAKERAERAREEAEEAAEAAKAKKMQEDIRREINREQWKSFEERKRQENAKYMRTAGVDHELIPGLTKFIFIFVRPITGTIFLFLVGLVAFLPFHQIITLTLSALISAGGWILFGSIRALLIPSFRENKKFSERRKNPINFLRATALLSAFFILLLMQLPLFL